MAEEKIGLIVEAALRQMEQVLKGLEDLDKRLAGLEKRMGAWSKAQKEAAKEVKKLTEEQKKLEQATKRLDKVEEKIVATLMALGRTSEQAHGELEAMEEGIEGVRTTTEGTDQAIARLEAQLRLLRRQLTQQVGGLEETARWWKRVILFWAVAAPPLRIVFGLVDALTEKLGEGVRQLQEYSEAQLEVSRTMEEYTQAIIEGAKQTSLFARGWEFLRDAFFMTSRLFEEFPRMHERTADALNEGLDGVLRYRYELEFLQARTEELAKVGFRLMTEELEGQREEILATSGSAKEYIEAIINLVFGSREAYEAATWLNKALFEQGLAYEFALGRAEALTALMAPQREAIEHLSALYVERAQLQQDAADRAEEAEARQAEAAQRVADQIEKAWSDLYEVTLPRMLEDHDIRMVRMAEDLSVRLAVIWARMETNLAKERSRFNKWMEDQEYRHQQRLQDIEERFREERRRIREKYREDQKKLNKSYQAKLRWIEVFGRKDLLKDLKKWKRDEQKELDEARKEEEKEARKERREARKEEIREYKRRVRLRKKEHEERLEEIREQAREQARLAEEAAARAAKREEEQYELRKRRAEEDAARRERELEASLKAQQDARDEAFEKQMRYLETNIKVAEAIHAAAMREYEDIMGTGGETAGAEYAKKFGHEMYRLKQYALDPAENELRHFGETQAQKMGHYGYIAAEAWARQFNDYFSRWEPPTIPGPYITGQYQAGLRYVPGTMDVTVHAHEAILPAREARAYRALTARVGALSRLQTVSTSRHYYEGGLEFNIGSIASEMDVLKLLGLVDRKLGTRVRRRMKFGGGRR